MNPRLPAAGIVPAIVLSLALSMPFSRAGTVTTLTDGTEYSGKLTLTPSAIHVEGASPTDVNLPDVLGAYFTDLPFELDFFSTLAGGSGSLPASWKALQVGPALTPGTATYADGAISISGEGVDAKNTSECYFFVGQPWNGSGQWTIRVNKADDANPLTEVGLMLRDGTDADSGHLSLGVATQKGKKVDGPQVTFQAFNGSVGGKRNAAAHSRPVSVQLPVWLRLTRSENNVDAAVSTDEKEWDVIGQFTLKNWDNTSIGLFVNSHATGIVGKAQIDNVRFTPVPGSNQILPTGALLRSGSFIAGSFEHLELAPAVPGQREGKSNFRGSGKPILIPPAKVAIAVLLPTPRSQITDAGSQVGLIMRNGDFLQGTPVSIGSTAVRMTSDLLGNMTYTALETRACILATMQPQSANYEVRLRDGSIIRANDLAVSSGQIVINEISGVQIMVDPDEIAQFRAGAAQTQNLLDLPWKATPPASASAPTANPAAVAANAAPATNTAPAANAAPAAAPAPPEGPSVQCWEGNNQEQIMMAPMATPIDFPITGKFRAMAMRIALSPDSPPGSTAVIRILADGREIGRTPAFKQGDQPRFLEISIQSPKSISLVADSPFPGTKILYIDPVLLH